MAESTTTQTLIWATSVASMAIVLMAMLLRRQFRMYPVFGSFVIYELVSGFIVRWYYLNLDKNHYWFVYWSNQLVEGILSLFVLQELFRVVLRPYSCFRSTSRNLFRDGAIVLIPIALWMGYATPHASLAEVTNSLVSFERSLSFVELSLVLLLFLFCSLFALHWRPYSLGIALGIGLWSCVELLASSYRVHLGYSVTDAYQWAAPLAFDVGGVIWAFWLVRREENLPESEALLSPQLARWDMALDELLVR